ncbi:U3 small nucleolar RNA-associated protein 25 [Spathaspora sp. JA1]|nr:U3 small nucleolar RNA-associated protein 25 [Spathaspora sp. JA1]
MARQVKRRSHKIVHDRTEQPDLSRKRTKHGRGEMRTVTRTAVRKPRFDQEPESNELPEEDEQEEEIQEEESEDGEFDRGQAYNALLTLLKSDHKERKPKKNQSREAEDQEEQEEEEEEDEDNVAGINMDEDQEEDDEHLDFVDDESPKELNQDPYEIHFNQPSEDYMTAQEKVCIKEPQKWTLAEKNTLSELSMTTMLQVPPGESISRPLSNVQSLDNYLLKKKVLDSYKREYSEQLTTLESTLLEPMLNYVDVNYQYKHFKNTQYRKLYSLHALNHIYKTRDRIIKNTTKLHNYKENKTEDEQEEEPEFRDQGFTRPKVLILLPTRESCYEVVETLIKLSGTEQQENRKKFTKQFHTQAEPPNNKPEDFIDAFKGNNNDFFCIGLKFTRKSLKLYSSFYSSDIILASPIGLSMILENPDKKKRQYDFISSIEVLIIDRANQIELQSWDHVNTVMKYINKIPKEFHDADFSRIRMWSINDQAKLLRQTLIFSEYQTPMINNLISHKSFNLAGKLKFKPIITQENSIMNSIGLKINQIFQRFESPSPMQDPDSRFKFFTNTILPSLLKTSSYEDGIMIFIPSYYDYLRVKSYFKTSTKFNFGSIDEYTSQSKLTRIRQQFTSGKIKILLYTERLHYFRRFEISGVKTLIMFGLPSNPIFYKELIRFIGKSIFKQECDLDLALVKILFSKWDAVTLERIVGNERAPVLCNSINETYEFR